MVRKHPFRLRRGQSMLIAVLAIGGAMLAATVIAGLLILYELRGATDTVNSSKAIFAADAGGQYALYDYFCSIDGRPCPSGPPTFTNGAAVAVACYTANNAATDCGSTSTVNYAVSKGTSLSTARAFYISITVATTTFP